MNQHLTHEQISEHLIGDAAPLQAQHARECDSCRLEIAQMEESLSEFRGAIRGWTSQVGSFSQAMSKVGTSVVHFDFERGMYGGNETRAGLSSLAIHAAMVALLLFLGTLKPVQKAMKEVVTLVAPAPPPVKLAENKGGGGGGARQPEVKKADLPKPSPRMFTPPRVDQVQTKLEVPASLVDTLPDVNSTNVGNLTGLNALNGNGFAGGIGSGTGGGIGNGRGSGAGSGSGGGSGGGAYKPGNGVSAPVPIYKPEPQYSEEARKNKWTGTVLLSIVVNEQGNPQDIHVVRPLGLGLDEKAIEAVSHWTFKPGMKDGKAVKVIAQVEITFRLL